MHCLEVCDEGISIFSLYWATSKQIGDLIGAFKAKSKAVKISKELLQ